MELKGDVLPGYRINEYQVILNPHDDLQERIKHVQEGFATTYKTEYKLGGRPNVGLVTWMQYEMYEARLRERLKLVGLEYPPFKVELKDFGSYPSHTIFINVASRLPVQNLIREIRERAQMFMKLNPETKPHFLQEPHITVARKLKPWQYEKGWLEYSHKHFTGKFIADAMLLLKRPQGTKSWQIAERFTFMNLPVQLKTEQGLLF